MDRLKKIAYLRIAKKRKKSLVDYDTTRLAQNEKENTRENSETRASIS